MAATRLLLCFIVFSSGIDFIYTVTDPRDVTILRSLKDQWENTPPSWQKSDDPCGTSWEGVTCNNSRVTALGLSTMGLRGKLSGDIGGLTELISLDLSFNRGLTGSLSPRIGDLQKLNILILAGCSFSGSIPRELGKTKRKQHSREATQRSNMYPHHHHHHGHPPHHTTVVVTDPHHHGHHGHHQPTVIIADPHHHPHPPPHVVVVDTHHPPPHHGGGVYVTPLPTPAPVYHAPPPVYHVPPPVVHLHYEGLRDRMADRKIIHLRNHVNHNYVRIYGHGGQLDANGVWGGEHTRLIVHRLPGRLRTQLQSAAHPGLFLKMGPHGHVHAGHPDHEADWDIVKHGKGIITLKSAHHHHFLHVDHHGHLHNGHIQTHHCHFTVQ